MIPLGYDSIIDVEREKEKKINSLINYEINP